MTSRPVDVSFAYSTPDPIRVELACTAHPAWYTPPHMASNKTTLESLAKLIADSSASADKKFAALAEDIADIKSTMVTKDDLAEAVEKLDDRLIAVESKIGGIHNRIDDEALKRRDLETRVRSVVPNLPPPPERV
jgi:hypothetical protein